MVRCSKCGEVFRAYPPDWVDQRKYARIKTRNLIYHSSIDETGKLVSQGLGQALNISKGGILLETPYPIESDLLSLMATDAENNKIEIKGKLIYCTKLSTGMYRSGIEFIGTDKRVEKFVSKLVREYNYRKNNLLKDADQQIHKPQPPPIPHNVS
jgi:hypothetical protein